MAIRHDCQMRGTGGIGLMCGFKPLLLVGCALVSTAALSVSAGAAEMRCGLIQNPTPGNWWFTDRDGSWTIRLQGGHWEPLGMDKIGDISAGDYRATNGNYGYACACAQVDTSLYEGERYITMKGSATSPPFIPSSRFRSRVATTTRTCPSEGKFSCSTALIPVRSQSSLGFPSHH